MTSRSWRNGASLTTPSRHMWCGTQQQSRAAFILYLSKSATLTKGGRVLALAVNGNYSSGVGNNGGVIAIVGKVNARGHEHFADVSGNEG